MIRFSPFTAFGARPVQAFTLAAAALLAPAAQAAGWDATTDFSATNNANGAWSYGSTDLLGGSFSLFGNHEVRVGTTGALDSWSAAAGGLPAVSKAGAVDWTCCGTVQVAANTLTVHAGPNGEYAVLRFTSPTAGSYQVTTSFWGQDFAGPTTTDAHVRAAGSDLFSANVHGFGPTSTQSWTGVVSLAAGESLDFAVGRGIDGNYYYSSTGLSASISAVPEPAAAALMLLGLAAVGVLARRRG